MKFKLAVYCEHCFIAELGSSFEIIPNLLETVMHQFFYQPLDAKAVSSTFNALFPFFDYGRS